MHENYPVNAQTVVVITFLALRAALKRLPHIPRNPSSTPDACIAACKDERQEVTAFSFATLDFGQGDGHSAKTSVGRTVVAHNLRQPRHL